MLAPAQFHADRLRPLFARRIAEDDAAYLFFENWANFQLEVDPSEVKRLQYVSVEQGRLLGYLEARVDRISQVVDDLLILRFDTGLAGEAVRDFYDFLHLLLVRRNFRKVVFRAVGSNPAMALYEKHLVGRLAIARPVGVIRNFKRLRDNRLHDLHWFEMDQSAFYECVKRHPHLFRGGQECNS